MFAIERTINVSFRHRVLFTEGMFDPANSLLRDTLRDASAGRARALMVVDANLAAAQPSLERLMIDYFEAHRDAVELAGAPLIVPGGEQVKRSLDYVLSVQSEIDQRHIDRHAYVIAAGGGGIPVSRQWDGSLHGVEAVIDKDLASRLLARLLGCEILCIVTGVDRVALDYGKPEQRDLKCATADELSRYAADGQFPPGSMGPKIQAAIEFVRGGGREAVITSPALLREALAGNAGTRIVR